MSKHRVFDPEPTGEFCWVIIIQLVWAIIVGIVFVASFVILAEDVEEQDY